MACSCRHNQKVRDGEEKRPKSPCIFCAEKHLSTAYALSKEIGYEGINRQWIIGELVLSQWHLKEHLDEAMEIRKIRHQIQSRREQDVKWEPILEKIGKLADKGN